MQRIGIYGGAFDPVHQAHVSLALAAKAQFQLDQVIFLPSGRPPHRENSTTSDEHRLAMLNIVTAGHQGLLVDDWELQQQFTTYTHDVLSRHFQCSEAEYFFLMGEDSLRQFSTWKNWKGILSFCHLVVAERDCDELPRLEEQLLDRVASFDPDVRTKAGNIYYLDFDAIPVSSTALRAEIQSEKGSPDLIDPAVLNYIRENRLYQNV